MSVYWIILFWLVGVAAVVWWSVRTARKAQQRRNK